MRLPLLVLALVLAGCAAQQDAPPALPDGVAVLGDSISRAMNAQPGSFQDHPQASWATGGDAADNVTSHLERLRAMQPGVEVVGFNDARSGARMADLAGQAEEAVKQRAQYVVILMGANDACASSLATMTSEDDYRAQLRAAADVLAGLPRGANVYLVSVPDVTQLRDAFADDELARAAWQAYRICPSALAPEGDPDAVRARIEAYNRILEDEAAARRWHWDGGIVFGVAYTPSEVSTLDYFHPSLEGQARLAHFTWNAGPYSGLVPAQ